MKEAGIGQWRPSGPDPESRLKQMVLFLLIAAVGNAVYHVSQKTLAPAANPMVLLMAVYALTGEASINRSNAMKNLNSLVLSLTSVAAFIWAGIVAWPQALAMMAAAAAGGFLGARLARRLPAVWVRGSVVATGLVMAAVFFRRG